MYKKFLLLLLILFVNGCISSNNNLNTISLATSKDTERYHDNVFKEHLNRIFKNETNKTKMYSLKTFINFESSNTLTSGSLSTLKKTIATVKYELYNLNTKKLLKTGSIKSSYAIGSTSSSLFSNDVNSEHIRERLNKNLALKLSRYLNLLISKLK
jgi:hypothetical protein